MPKKPSTDAPEKAPDAAAPEAKKPRAKETKDAPEAAAAQAPAGKEQGPKKKGRQPGVPPRIGKKLRTTLKTQKNKIAKEGTVSLKKAIQLLKTLKKAKFDETVEVHMSLGIDSAQSDQMIRGAVPLPHGLGKPKRVLVFCQGDNQGKAREAGADYVGAEDFIKKIQTENWLDFDVALATQDMMGMVSRLGKILGPRGLMPTPKAGTVVPATGDIGLAVREFKAGKVEYRSDKGGNVHAGIGKMSFEEDKLVANITAFVDQVRAVKPSGIKGNYIKSITVAGTMTAGVPVTM